MVDTRFSVSLENMLTVAYGPDELLNSASLAKVLKSNATFVRKLTANLASAQLIESFRGKNGGIRLAKTPQQISLKDIYLAATDEKRLINCHSKPVTKCCPISCSIEDIFNDISHGIEKSTLSFLSDKKLSDLLRKI